MIPVLFENEHFVVVDKPAGYLSVPSRMPGIDERRVVGTLLQDQVKTQIFPVHRLDFEVSGILLFAKTAQAHRSGNNWFENKKVQKIYSCISANSVAFEPGQNYEWKCQLLRGKKRAYESPAGKPSLTRAQLLKRSEKGLVWNLEPVTGRAHQLRYEMYRHQMPILGDRLYGSQVSWGDEGIALRAFQLHFLDPQAQTQYSLPKSIITAALD